jgi:uncharacterized membrane protein YqiK
MPPHPAVQRVELRNEGRKALTVTQTICVVHQKKGTNVPSFLVPLAIAVVALLVVTMPLWRSFTSIGPSEIGLVTKRLGKKLDDGHLIARNGEAGYQAELLMPGLRFKLWPIFAVTKYPWVQVPAGEIGVVIAQVGNPLPVGNKSAEYKTEFGNFDNLTAFLDGGGQKGVQRPVIPPGTTVPIHPVAFIVLTSGTVYGEPVSPDLQHLRGQLSADAFGIKREQLQVQVIAPEGDTDYIGIVTTLEGKPLDSGDIASRLGGYDDIKQMEQRALEPAAEDAASTTGEATEATSETIAPAQAAEIIEVLLGSKNDLHNNYQDFQAFVAADGRIGLQHDPLLYGAYLLNPFLVRVERVPMLVVKQGEVAVIKAFVGLPTVDTSGTEFKFGAIVSPGHRGIWGDPLRTGKYAINPRCYAAEIVPTSILTLNWAEAVSQAHNLDAHLSPIEAKSREGFVFKIDLQVQIHVPDTKAPKVISMVGTMLNLVNEVLQSAVGNHFRNTLQSLEAVAFIETRNEVQAQALATITEYLAEYQVETKGVYIQDVDFPDELVQVLTEREIANQQQATYAQQEAAQNARINMERARGTAEKQGDLASSAVSIEIKTNEAKAREAEADGEAAYVTKTGTAEATVTKLRGTAEAEVIEAKGLAQAKGYEAQTAVLGADATATVAIFGEIASGDVKIVPDLLVNGGGAVDGVLGLLMKRLDNPNGNGHTTGAAHEAAADEPAATEAAATTAS